MLNGERESMKKINKKCTLGLILFASIFSTSLMNQKSYATKAVEVGKYEITIGSGLGATHAFNNAEELEAQYSTPEGISWVNDCSNAYGFSGFELHLGNLVGQNGGHVSLKLDSGNYYVTKVMVNARRFSIATTKATLYVNNKEASGYLQSKEKEYTFDLAQDKTQNVKIGIKNQGGYISKIQVYYETNFDLLLNDIISADTCNDYEQAADFRKRYNYLSSNDYTRFNNTKITDVDQNGNMVEFYALEKLEYMEYLTSLHSAKQNGQNQSLTQKITEKKSIVWMLMIGAIIMCMSVYSIVIKRKWNKQK